MVVDPRSLYIISADLTVLADTLVLLDTLNKNDFSTGQRGNELELLNQFANSELYSCCVTLLDDLKSAIEVRKK